MTMFETFQTIWMLEFQHLVLALFFSQILLYFNMSHINISYTDLVSHAHFKATWWAVTHTFAYVLKNQLSRDLIEYFFSGQPLLNVGLIDTFFRSNSSKKVQKLFKSFQPQVYVPRVLVIQYTVGKSII